MSQAGVIRNGSAGMGSVDTLTGDVGGAVGPDGANNINILSGQGLVTVGNPGTNTITILLNGASDGNVTTVGAVTAQALVIPLGAVPGVYTFDARIAAFEAGTPSGAGYTIVGAVRTTGAAAILIPGQAVDAFEEAALVGASAALTVAGNNARFTVTGVALLTIDWVVDSFFTFAS
jgi:hypothetical protein